MQEGGRELHRNSFSEKARRIFSPREWKWRIWSAPREKLKRVFKSEADAVKYITLCEEKRILGGLPALDIDMHRSISKMKEEAGKSEAYKAVSRRNRELLRLVLTWMDNEYTGFSAHMGLLEHPPLLVSGTDVPFKKAVGSACFYGTNCISVRFFGREGGREEDRIADIAHELHHYASWFSRAHNVRWRDEEGRPVFGRAELGTDAALTESLTEMHALQLIREHGVDRSRVERAGWVYFALHLQEMAGEEALRRAYFTGDYTRVKVKVDGRLGDWAFDEIFYAVSERGVFEGLAVLQRRAREARFSSEEMYGKPFVKEIYGACHYGCPVFPFSVLHGEFK